VRFRRLIGRGFPLTAVWVSHTRINKV